MSARRTTARPKSALQPRRPLPVRSLQRDGDGNGLSKVSPSDPINKLPADALRRRFNIPDTDLSGLRAEKAKALTAEKFDIDLVDAIQRLIDLKQTDTSSQVIGHYAEWLTDGILPALAEMDAQLAAVDEEMDELEFNHRAEIDELFEYMKEDHIAQLAEIEYHRSIEELREQSRVSGGRIALQKTARTLGATDDIELARRVIREEARLKEEEEKNGQARLQKKFEKLRRRKLREQLQAIEQLQANFNARLDEKDRLKAEKRAAVEQKAAVYIKSQLQRAIMGASEHLPVASRKTAPAKLTQAVKELLAEKNKAFLLV